MPSDDTRRTSTPAKPSASATTSVAKQSSASDIADFVAKVKTAVPVSTAAAGRLIFALDATMSRQPTWDMACTLQADMFREAGSIGGLAIRLIYFRGLGECRATTWIADTTRLARLMTAIQCEGGHTQIGRVLADAKTAARMEGGVRALVFVGDAMEENADDLCVTAGELGLLKVPCFMFQEGRDPGAEATFREIARLSGGAWCRFDPGSAAQLRDLLRAVAAYAAGGRSGLTALSQRSGGAAQQLLAQIR